MVLLMTAFPFLAPLLNIPMEGKTFYALSIQLEALVLVLIVFEILDTAFKLRTQYTDLKSKRQHSISYIEHKCLTRKLNIYFNDLLQFQLQRVKCNILCTYLNSYLLILMALYNSHKWHIVTKPVTVCKKHINPFLTRRSQISIKDEKNKAERQAAIISSAGNKGVEKMRNIFSFQRFNYYVFRKVQSRNCLEWSKLFTLKF